MLHSSYVLYVVLVLLATSAPGYSSSHTTAPLLGQIWEECAPQQVNEYVDALKRILPAYHTLQVGRNCTPSKDAAPPSKSGISLGLNFGEDCQALTTLDTHQLTAWNVSLVSLSKTCLQRSKYRFVLSKRQQAKLHGFAVAVCTPDELDSPWTWAPPVADQWCIPGASNPDMSEWDRVISRLDNTVAMAQFAGPGGWNDLGPLQVGAWTEKVSAELQAAMDRSQFALWAVMKSPLMVAADPQKLSKSELEVLNNEALISVNQDILGVPGALIWKQGPLELYAGPISDPTGASKLMGQRVVVCFNRADYPSSDRGCVINWAQLGYQPNVKVVVQDLFNSTLRTEQIYQYTTGTVGARDVIALRLSPYWAPETAKMKWDMWRPWQQNSELFQNRCKPPGAIVGGVVMMTIAVIAIAFAGLTVYWERSPRSKKGFQPLNDTTKSEEQA